MHGGVAVHTVPRDVRVETQSMCNQRRRYAALGAALLIHLSVLCFFCGSTTAWIFSAPIVQPLQRWSSHKQHVQSRRARHDNLQRTSLKATTSAVAVPGSTSSTDTDTGTDTEKDPRPSSTAIVGGGPTGLAVALMLARRGYRDITVLERLAEPPPPASGQWGNPERSYNLGIGGRGQVALAKLGAADKVMSWCADAVVSLSGPLLLLLVCLCVHVFVGLKVQVWTKLPDDQEHVLYERRRVPLPPCQRRVVYRGGQVKRKQVPRWIATPLEYMHIFEGSD